MPSFQATSERHPCGREHFDGHADGFFRALAHTVTVVARQSGFHTWLFAVKAVVIIPSFLTIMICSFAKTKGGALLDQRALAYAPAMLDTMTALQVLAHFRPGSKSGMSHL